MTPKRVPPATADDRKLDECLSLMFGRPAGQNSKTDPGLPPLSPRHVHAAMRDFSKGGLPGNSTPEAISGTREAQLPALDKVDRRLEVDRPQYPTMWSTLLTTLQWLRATENFYRPLLMEAEPEPEAGPPLCTNGTCTRVCEKTRASYRSVCAACRGYKKDHGIYPAKPEHVQEHDAA